MSNGGNIILNPGTAFSNFGGNIIVTAGTGTGGFGGNIILTTGISTSIGGFVTVIDCPEYRIYF